MNDKNNYIKTATITFHAPENNGAFLQAYALQYYIESILGINNIIIDFRSEAQKRQYDILHSQKGKRGLFRDICNCLHYVDLISRKEKYVTLQKKYLKSTSECHEIREVLEQALAYDVLICGSDQIWNAELNDFSPVYYLPGIRNKISYACSLGSSYSEKNRQYMEKYIREFEAVSVREEDSAEYIRNEFGIESVCCVDPTLLVDHKIYEIIIQEEKIPVPDNYIFLYTVKFYNYILELSEILSSIYKLPVYTILSSPSSYAGMRAEKHRVHVIYSGGPADFLTYIKNASLVLSDSFHGIIFSVIFHKNFFRGQAVSCGVPIKDERLDSFLDLVGLSDRVVLQNQREIDTNSGIKWADVDEKLNMLAKESGEWLKQSISAVSKKKKDVTVPQLVEEKHNCCGCGACSVACPTQSIIMLPDDEGFEYPRINPHTCIGCNVCIKACSFKADQNLKGLD